MTDTMTPQEPTAPSDTSTPEMPSVPPASPPDASATPEPTFTPNIASDASQGESEAPEKDSGIPTVPTEKPKHSGMAGKIESIADDYVIPISDEAIKTWAKQGDEKSFKTYAQQVAIGLYPTFAAQIQMGMPTRILLDPYIQVAEQVLGEQKDEPNWSDPKWNAALQGSKDPKTGRPVPMTLDEWRKFLRQHPGHKFVETPQAMEMAHKFGADLNKAFGGELPQPATSEEPIEQGAA